MIAKFFPSHLELSTAAKSMSKRVLHVREHEDEDEDDEIQVCDGTKAVYLLNCWIPALRRFVISMQSVLWGNLQGHINCTLGGFQLVFDPDSLR